MTCRLMLSQCFACCLCLLVGFPAINNCHAEDFADLPSVVTVSAGFDNDGGSDYYLDANLALPDGQRAVVSFGTINYPSDSEFNSNLDPLNFLLGFDSGPGLMFPIGIEYELWGEDEEFVIEALRGKVGFNSELFSISITPQNREFELFFENGNSLKFNSKGYNLGLDISGVENFFFSLGYTKNDYDFTVFRLLTLLVLREPDVLRRIIELSALDVIRQRLVSAASFDDRKYNINLSYYLNWGEIGVYWIRSRSILKDPDTNDQLVSDIYGVSSTIDLSADWSAGLLIGTQSSRNDDTSLNFGTLSISYYW